MAIKYVLPSAVDHLRMYNDNIIANLLAGKPAYVRTSSLYERAYNLVHETGPVRVKDGIPVADPVQAPPVVPGRRVVR